MEKVNDRDKHYEHPQGGGPVCGAAALWKHRTYEWEQVTCKDCLASRPCYWPMQAAGDASDQRKQVLQAAGDMFMKLSQAFHPVIDALAAFFKALPPEVVQELEKRLEWEKTSGRAVAVAKLVEEGGLTVNQVRILRGRPPHPNPLIGMTPLNALKEPGKEVGDILKAASVGFDPASGKDKTVKTRVAPCPSCGGGDSAKNKRCLLCSGAGKVMTAFDQDVFFHEGALPTCTLDYIDVSPHTNFTTGALLKGDELESWRCRHCRQCGMVVKENGKRLLKLKDHTKKFIAVEEHQPSHFSHEIGAAVCGADVSNMGLTILPARVTCYKCLCSVDPATVQQYARDSKKLIVSRWSETGDIIRSFVHTKKFIARRVGGALVESDSREGPWTNCPEEGKGVFRQEWDSIVVVGGGGSGGQGRAETANQSRWWKTGKPEDAAEEDKEKEACPAGHDEKRAAGPCRRDYCSCQCPACKKDCGE